MRQIWAMGSHDKKLLSIISTMLKAGVAGIGFPEKGTPQGGSISPLLSDIVLNKRENEIVGGEPDEGEEPPEKKPRDVER